jgi:hypothetical protein
MNGSGLVLSRQLKPDPMFFGAGSPFFSTVEWLVLVLSAHFSHLSLSVQALNGHFLPLFAGPCSQKNTSGSRV